MRRGERGYVLLAFLILMIVIGAAAIIPRLAGIPKDQEKTAKIKTQKALLAARDALISAAISEDNVPGTLPCPTLESGQSCDQPSGGVIGRFPWKTLGSGSLVDGDGECLWYALSVSHRSSVTIPSQCRNAEHRTSETACSSYPSVVAINPATAGGISLNGDFAVAVILAPGKATATSQNAGRLLPAGNVCKAGATSAFLESVSTTNEVVSSIDITKGNDSIVVITNQDLMTAVAKRELKRLALSLSDLTPPPGKLGAFRAALTPSVFDAKLLNTGESLNYAKALSPSICPRVLPDPYMSLTYKHPASYLCLNGWYPLIDVSGTNLSVTLPSSIVGGSAIICTSKLGLAKVTCQ